MTFDVAGVSVLSDNALRFNEGRGVMPRNKRTPEQQASETIARRQRYAADKEYAETERARARAKNKKLPDEIRARHNARQRENWPAWRERHRVRKRSRVEKWPLEKWIWHSAKNRARITGVPFSISESDIAVPVRCPVLGIDMRRHKGVPQDDSYSLDRIDNTKGYVPGNVQVISRRANRLKNDATIEELESLVAHLKSLRERSVRFDEGESPT